MYILYYKYIPMNSIYVLFEKKNLRELFYICKFKFFSARR